MDLPTIYRYFERYNEEKIEKQDLTYNIFKDIDYTKLQYKTSFYRSDFRGSKFENIVFYQNNFDIADFINNIFINVEFKDVNWGEAEVKNCAFFKCYFKNNTYISVPFNNCSFTQCDFSDEEFRLTMKDCSFKECTLKKIVFNQCSTDRVEFDNCTIIKCEMSTMHAENYKIIDCIFRDTFLGINYLGTYLIKGTDFNLLNFKYRGEIVPIADNTFFINYTYDMFKHYRYYEYLNLIILLKINELNLENEVIRVINNIDNIDNKNYKLYTINCIFDMLEFYMGTKCLEISTLFNIIIIFQKYKEQFKEDEKLVIECKIFRLLSLIATLNLNTEYLLFCNPDKVAYAEFTFNTDDIEEAKQNLNSIITIVNHKLLNNYYSLPYTITSIKQGSVIITITASLMIILLAAKVIKSVCHSMCKMQIEIASSKKMLNMIENSKSSGTLLKTIETYNDLEKRIKSDDLEISNLSKLIIQLIGQ